MRRIEYKDHEVIFREGDEARTMFRVDAGSVGIYADFGGADECELATVAAGEVFGEMGLVECYPRTATAVALTDDCVVEEIEATEFAVALKDQPDVVLRVMRQLCARLRETNEAYVEACRAIYEAVEVERAGEDRSLSLIGCLKRLLAGTVF